MWTFVIKLLSEVVELALLCPQGVCGWPRGFRLERAVHAFMAPVLCGLPGSMSSGNTPRRIHHADNCDSRASVLVANGTPLSVRIRCGKPYSLKIRVNTGFAC